MNYTRWNENENKLIRSGEYKNNNLKYSQEFAFNFFVSKFYWKELMKINTKYIERTSDISSLYPYIQNILYTRLNLDNIDILSEQYIIQLVTLLQLTGQYLVYAQKMLEEENLALKETIKNLQNNITDNEKYERIIENLNRQNTEKDFMIKTYQDMIQNGNIEKNGIDEDNKNVNLKSVPEIKYINKTLYYCSICLKKKFKTQKYLDEHMMRRHFNQKELIINKEDIEEKKVEEDNYHLEFEEKLNSMKTEFINLINQKEQNNELSILNKKLDLLQTQILSQNYNNNINFRSNINYYNKKNYRKVETKKEREDKSLILLQLKYDELNKKYNELKIKFEEKDETKIDFNRQSTYKTKKDKTEEKKIKENFENINIDGQKINIEIKPIKNNIIDINLTNIKKESEKKINKLYIDKNIDINIIDNFGIEKKKEGKNKNINNLKKGNEINIILESKIKLDNDLNKDSNSEKDNKKFLTNDGNETLMIEQKNISKNEGMKNSINNKISNNSNQLNNEDNKELEQSKHSEKDNKINKDIILKNQNNNLKDEESQKSINKEIEVNPPIKEINEKDKLKMFYQQVDERDKNCLKGKITDYQKTEISDEPDVQFKDLLKNKKHSEEFIKNYKNYDYLDKELGIQELFDAYNKLKKERKPNQMIVNKSSFENSNTGGHSRMLKSSTSINIIQDNPYKSKMSKKNEVIESSFIKGFDLVKSTK